MSQENVEIVRDIYEAVARRDTETVLGLYDPDVEWDFSRSSYKNVTGRDRYQGHEGLREWWQDWGEMWAAYEDQLTDLIEAGDHVISVVQSRGRGRASGARVELEQYGVWTLRRGKVIRVAWFISRDEALEAAGLSEYGNTARAMSEENVEIVRFAYEEGLAKRSTDHPKTPEKVADDFRFHARRGFPGRPVYRLDEVTALWADLDATFTDYSIYPDGYEAIGEYVLVCIRQSARLKGSDERLDDTLYHLWHVVDGKAKEAWAYGRREEALEAAGLSE